MTIEQFIEMLPVLLAIFLFSAITTYVAISWAEDLPIVPRWIKRFFSARGQQ